MVKFRGDRAPAEEIIATRNDFIWWASIGFRYLFSQGLSSKYMRYPRTRGRKAKAIARSNRELNFKLRLRKDQCNNCPFLKDSPLHDQRLLTRIYRYLIDGTNHVCHATNRHVCRGGRDFQLNLFHQIGHISEPTDQALLEVMRSRGIEPKYK